MKAERFLADENFPTRVADWLRECGSDVVHAAFAHAGASDERLLEVANAEGRILLTFDRDFGELVFRRGLQSERGVVLFRLARLSASVRRGVARSFFESQPELAGFFTVVSPGHYRRVPLVRA